MARLPQASGHVRREESDVSASVRPQPTAKPIRRWTSMALLSVLAYCGSAQAYRSAAATANASQPAIRATPPTGVMVPNQLALVIANV